MKLLFQLFASASFALSAKGFVVNQRTASSSSKLMASRRDFMSNAVAATAVLVVPNIAGAATAEKEATKESPTKKEASSTPALLSSFQGVFSDPKHPKGYRIIVSKGSGSAIMTLSDGKPKDGSEPKLFNLPVMVKQDKKTGTTLLTFDFSPKGGPKNIIGTLGKDGNTISFPDGNTWKKNTGVEGVYKDGSDSKAYRVIRKDKGSDLIVELRKDASAKNPALVSAKSGSSKKDGAFVNIDFPGKKSSDPTEKVKGSFDNGTISFPDGNKWTKL